MTSAAAPPTRTCLGRRGAEALKRQRRRHFDFKRQFNLTDYVQVKNASFGNGLLKVEPVGEFLRP